jgi:hypothetical protein
MKRAAVLTAILILVFAAFKFKVQKFTKTSLTTSLFDSAQGKPPGPLSTTITSPLHPSPDSGEGRWDILLYDVPFTVQAPTGEWENEIFQDGCEEASALMAECKINNLQCTIRDGKIDPNWARGEIIKMAEWQREKYGGAVDTSAFDTAKRLLGEYFKIHDSRFMIQELKNSGEFIDLLKNNVLIVPMNGQKLGNPYFTAPGPERHMVVVIGYDPETDEIITNDGGTRHGKGYRYKRSVFWNAIRDYPTGNHEPILKIEKRAIVIKI